MSTIPACPICYMENTYPDNMFFICADCGHEWQQNDNSTEGNSDFIVKDANGNVLQQGDSVILIKELKVKGSSLVIKKGTKVKNIRLVDSDHNIDCKIDGIAMRLKSEFMKKA